MVCRVESLAEGAKINKHPGITLALSFEFLGPSKHFSRSFPAEDPYIPLEQISGRAGENYPFYPRILCFCQVEEDPVGAHAMAVKEEVFAAASSQFIYSRSNVWQVLFK